MLNSYSNFSRISQWKFMDLSGKKRKTTTFESDISPSFFYCCKCFIVTTTSSKIVWKSIPLEWLIWPQNNINTFQAQLLWVDFSTNNKIFLVRIMSVQKTVCMPLFCYSRSFRSKDASQARLKWIYMESSWRNLKYLQIHVAQNVCVCVCARQECIEKERECRRKREREKDCMWSNIKLV